jgi:hypothetical protein
VGFFNPWAKTVNTDKFPEPRQLMLLIIKSRAQRDQLIAYGFLLPNIIGFLLFMLGPILASVMMSLFRWDIFTAPTFIDWDNFIEVFSQGSGFWQYLGNTLFFSLSVPLSFEHAGVSRRLGRPFVVDCNRHGGEHSSCRLLSSIVENGDNS